MPAKPDSPIDRMFAAFRAFIASDGMTRNRLAKLARLPESTIRTIGEPGWNPEVNTVRQIWAALPAEYRRRACRCGKNGKARRLSTT